MTTDGLSDAKQTLLRALESIEEVEQDLGTEVRHVAVVYSVYRRDDKGRIHEQAGWNHSSDPTWLIAALLRRGADSVAVAGEPDDEEE